MKVPFVDLTALSSDIKSEILRQIELVSQDASFILGKEVELFEEEFASFHQVKYGIGVNSGTDALYLSLLACGVQPGDEVITVANSFIATALAISRVGAKPVLVDIDSQTYNIDVDKIEEVITSKTKAIIPVHLYGKPVEMSTILDLASHYYLKVIEDACQAHGSFCDGKFVGSIGDVGCFSFYPGKNLGSYGDGGIVITNNEEIATSLKLLRNYGQKKKYYHSRLGFNSRLSTVQAAVLRVKLKYLVEWSKLRRAHAKFYKQLFADNVLITVSIDYDFLSHVYHLYVIRVKNRDSLQNYLTDKGITTGIHYPVPIHFQEAYRYLGYKVGDFPITERYADEILSLPMYPELTQEQVIYVADKVKEGLHNAV